MKKLLTILATVVLALGISGCDTAMHDGTSVYVKKVRIEGLTNLAGQQMNIAGNWILGSDGTSTWVTADTGVTSALALGAIGTVDASGNVEFAIDQITSEPSLEFLGRVVESGWSNPHRFGVYAYSDKDGNAKINNPFTGPGSPKMILGVVGSDNLITYTVEDTN